MDKIAIVNRSFWPTSPVIGEALLLLSESLTENSQPIVITQVRKGFFKYLKDTKRASGVKFSVLPSVTNSSSHMVMRIFEIVIFTFFVFIMLCWHRPNKVYVATNPPIFTPLAIRVYCSIFNCKFIYHLQDIHPEATQITTGKNNWVTNLLRFIDINTILKANVVITLTKQMKIYIESRVGKKIPIILLSNPSVQNKHQDDKKSKERIKGFIYCGNAGRLQRIPLLLEAITQYLKEGGTLPFVFAGGGVYSHAIKKLASEFEQVNYLGVLPAERAAELLREYSFGLLPIDDEVTNYAFPSKSSSYVFSGCKTVAICGENTSVAEWVVENNLGFVVEPEVNKIVSFFNSLEGNINTDFKFDGELIMKLSLCSYVASLNKIILDV